MASFDDQIIQDIQARLDIVDIVGETVTLSRKGNRYWGLCPFHQEKTGSFCVTPDKNMFYCFGCHAGGDIFSFVMKRDGLEFKEAVEFLAAKAGVELIKSHSPRKHDQRKNVIEVNKAALEFYRQTLMSQQGKTVVEYLKTRGISPQTMEKFQLGYAPEKWNSLEDFLLKKGFAQEAVKLSGLIKRSENKNSYYDLFRKRLMFPINHYNGEIIGFGGRVLDDSLPKYLNTPETDVFSKRKSLYGLYQARETIRQVNEVIIVEGYMDCIKLHQSGITNTVASLGTAFTLEQAQLLHRYTEKVLLLYDADEAGQRETIRAISILLEEGLKVFVVTLPGTEDPDEFVERCGKEGFLQYIQNNKISYIEFKLNRYLKGDEVLNLESKIRIIDLLKDDIERLRSELEKDHYIKMVAQKLMIEENLVQRELKSGQKTRAGIKRNKSKIIRDNIKYVNYGSSERILAVMFKNQRVFERVKHRIGFDFLGNSEYKILAEIYDGLEGNEEQRLDKLGLLANRQNLGSSYARIALLQEEYSLPDEIELEGFIREVERRKQELRWNRQFNRLNRLSTEGDFHTILNFILNMNRFLNDTQEGGKR